MNPKQPVVDSIHFSGKKQIAPDEKKLELYAKELLEKDTPIKPGQKIKISADSSYLPLVHAMVEIAYRDYQAGRIIIDLKEPEIEALKEKYGIKEEFDYKRKRDESLQKDGAKCINLSSGKNKSKQHYKKAGLSPKAIDTLIRSMSAEISPEAQKLLEVDPDEFLKNCMDFWPGQPIAITAAREHMPQVLRLLERVYQNGTKLVDLNIVEDKRWELSIPFYKYASEDVLTEVPAFIRDKFQEYLDKNVARLYLDGEDPSLYEGIDSVRISKSQVAMMKAIKDLKDRMIVENPWPIYYYPSEVSARAADPPYLSLEEAAIDMREINRIGKLKEHCKNLQDRTNKLNDLAQQGYRMLHFISVDPKTGQPDGKTDLRVGLSSESVFSSVGEKTTRGQEFVANIPSEESFTTPDWTKTEGVVSMTRPLSINGNIIDGIRMKFKNGQIAKDPYGNYYVEAAKNQDVLLAWLNENENADKLGEVSLVADSPIFKLGRIFNMVLVDENATCHIALGSGYSSCIRGADEIKDFEKKKEYLNSVNCNDSTTHVDFMIGGPHVEVYAEKSHEKGAERKLLIKDDKFQL